MTMYFKILEIFHSRLTAERRISGGGQLRMMNFIVSHKKLEFAIWNPEYSNNARIVCGDSILTKYLSVQKDVSKYFELEISISDFEPLYYFSAVIWKVSSFY